MSLVALGALAALGGAYSWSAAPLLAGAVLAFLVARAQIGATPSTRSLDVLLAACCAVTALQMAGLPSALVSALSPRSAGIQELLALAPAVDVRPLSIDAQRTRTGLMSMAAAVLIFWAARETFARGGLRLVSRTIAVCGMGTALVGLVQRVTAPKLLLWTWTPLDPGAQPFGPFVNRNHFATWLLMAASLTAGYLVAHVRSHGLGRHGSGRLVARDLLADGGGLLLAGATGAMLLALLASVSRAAMLGLAASLAFGAWMALRRTGHDRGVRLAGATLLVLLAGAVVTNGDALASRLDASLANAEVGRPVIWRETLPVIGDFWLTGTGVGTYAQAMLRYQQTNTATLFNQAHNEYLQLVAEGGLLLAAPAFLVVVTWLRLARQRLRQEHRNAVWIRVGAAGGLLGLAVQSVFETGLRMPANALLCAILAAAVVYERRDG